MMDRIEGWKRWLLHFGAWLGIPSAVFYAFKSLHWYWSPWWAWPAWGAVTAVIIYREIRSTGKQKQTKGKMFVDIFAKLLGWSLAVFTAPWWWN